MLQKYDIGAIIGTIRVVSLIFQAMAALSIGNHKKISILRLAAELRYKIS